MQNLKEFIQTKLIFENLSQPLEDYIKNPNDNSIYEYDSRFDNKGFFDLRIDKPLSDLYNEYLFESLLVSYSLDGFLKKLSKMFSVQSTGRKVNNSCIELVVGDFDKNNLEFKSLCNLYNVFISNEKKLSNGLTLVTFEQTKPLDVTEQVYQENTFLYHITSSKYVDKILKYGLQPKSHSKKSYHPERVYLLTSYSSPQIIRNMMKLLGGDVLLKVDIQKFKNQYNQKLKFYIDPKTITNGDYISIFTENTIYPQVLSVVK